MSLLAHEDGGYFFGLIHLPPITRDNTTNAIATHEKAVLSVANPMERNARPRIRNIIDEFLRFIIGLYVRYALYILNKFVLLLQIVR